MNLGVLKEDPIRERRVALTPAGVQSLVAEGHTVYVQHDAGVETIFSDDEYRDSGGMVSYDAEEVLNRSEVVLKVSPPTESELSRLNAGQAFLSFLHLAVSQKKTIESLLARKATSIAYELIEDAHRDLTVLQVMSEIAGQFAIHVAGHYLQSREGGRGILLGNVPGVAPASVVILGAGNVGATAARVASALGAEVTVLDKDLRRLRDLHTHSSLKIHTGIVSDYNIARALRHADVVIGAILLKGERTPHIVSEAVVKGMKIGSVIVDVSIDQGGCIETSRPTTLDDPVFRTHGVVHYCVPNMTAAIPRTASIGLTNALLPYLITIARNGIAGAVAKDQGLAHGVCTYDGFCTNESVARAFDVSFKSLRHCLPTPFETRMN
jgi:alanine dehydrogenase